MIRIAIDGPAASGKSAVGSAVAARLRIPFIDTGIMYRAVTWLSLERGVSAQDATALGELASAATIAITQAPVAGSGGGLVTIDGLDATPHLRDVAVERSVSQVSAVPAVRERLVQLQRQLAAGSVVMAGRDIGSVVLPDADLKVFLDASPEERARRRERELRARGETAGYEALLGQMRQRDHLDSTRALAPLRAAADAVCLRTDGLNLSEVVGRVLDLVTGPSLCGSPCSGSGS